MVVVPLLLFVRRCMSGGVCSVPLLFLSPVHSCSFACMWFSSAVQVCSVLMWCTTCPVFRVSRKWQCPYIQPCFLLGTRRRWSGVEYAKQLDSSGPVQSPRVDHASAPESGQDKLGRSLSRHLLTELSTPSSDPHPRGSIAS